MKKTMIKLYITTYKTKYVQFYGVLFVDDMFTHRQLFRSRTVELFGEKPDFNPFKNNNNQIEKLPKKQKKIIWNVSTNQNLLYSFTSSELQFPDFETSCNLPNCNFLVAKTFLRDAEKGRVTGSSRIYPSLVLFFCPLMNMSLKYKLL